MLINQTHQQNQNMVILIKTNFSKPSQASSRKHKSMTFRSTDETKL